MDFLHVPAPCPLVESVDVLRDYAVQLPGLLHLGKLIMRPVGLNAVGIELLPVEFIEDFRAVFETVYAQKILGRISVELDVVLVIKSVLRPEVRDPALCGNARASEENDMLTFSNDLIQLYVII